MFYVTRKWFFATECTLQDGTSLDAILVVIRTPDPVAFVEFLTECLSGMLEA